MNRNKKMYVPGLISLIGLPVLLYLFPIADPVLQNVVKMTLPSEDKSYPAKDSSLTFSHAFIVKKLKGKKVEQIYLRDNYTGTDISGYLLNQKLDFIKHEMERLQFTNDTATVLKISFGSENTYGQFMLIQNFALLDRYRRYALDDYDFYLFPEAPPMFCPIDDSYTGGSYSTSNTFPYTRWDMFRWKIRYNWQALVYAIRENTLLCSGFFVLIVLPFLISLFRLWFRRRMRFQIRQVSV